MKTMKAIYPIVTGLVLLLALLLAACTADDSNDQKGAERQLHISLASSIYQNDGGGTNRALPTDYVELTNTLLLQSFPNGKDLLAFIAHTTNASEVFVRRMNYVTKDNNVTDWEKNITITNYSAPYCIYGFIPISDDTSDNVSVSLLNTNSNYGEGAKMTISNLKPLTKSDPCVIVGAKECGTETDIKNVDIKLGAFSYNFDQNTTTDKICMLLDHLYAKFKFKIAVGAEYDALRTVKVKKMLLETLDDNNNVVSAVTATVNIEANTSSTNPISSVSFNRTTTGTSTPFTLFNSTTPLELETTTKDVCTCLAPYDQERFLLTTDYEVYDKKGNLLKEHTGVTNKFTANINNSLKKRGYIHTVTITVNPTYLQVLSDDDLEPPTIKVN